MRRDPETPNGLTEFLVVRAIELLRERGVEELSLNFAAFAKWIHSPARRHERVLGKLIALGNPFFQIESLYRFNAEVFPALGAALPRVRRRIRAAARQHCGDVGGGPTAQAPTLRTARVSTSAR